MRMNTHEITNQQPKRKVAQMRTLTIFTLLMSLATIACSQDDKTKTDSKVITEEATTMQAPTQPTFDFLPDVVATVGDKQITREMVVGAIYQRANQDQYFAYMEFPKLTTKEAVRDAVLNSMLDYEFLKIAAQKAGYKADSETTLKMINAQLANYTPEQMKEIEERLKTERNQTLDQYKQELVNIPDAQTQAQVSAFMETEIMPKADSVTEADIDRYYKQELDTFAMVSHILITPENTASREKGEMPMDKTTDSAKAKAKTELTTILEKIKKDTDLATAFATAAAEHSMCPSGKSAQGSLGRNARGRMVPEFDAVTFSMKPGTISEVFASPFGYHIIYRVPAEVEKAVVKEEAPNKKFQEIVRAKIDEVKKDVKVKINI